MGDLACVKVMVEGHDVETGISLTKWSVRKGRRGWYHAHLYNRQQRKNSLRLSNT